VSTLNSSIVSYRNHIVCRVKVVKAQEGLQRYVVHKYNKQMGIHRCYYRQYAGRPIELTIHNVFLSHNVVSGPFTLKP